MIFDAHGDILTDMYEQKKKGLDNSFKKRHLEAYKKGNVTHSIFVNWTSPKENNPQVFYDTFDYAFDEIDKNQDIFMKCYNYSDMQKSMESGKIGVILGIEGIKNLKDVTHLQELYAKGVRHATLTWNESNKYANGLDNKTDGLSIDGFEIIKEMNKLGMIVDLAHANEHTFKDIILTTTSPVIISHGNTKALCNHRRNYTDEQLQMIKEKDGVIGICALQDFISDKKENQNVQYMAKHIEYVKELIGIDHVGFGFDLCYYLKEGVEENKLDGFKTMSDTSNLIDELLKLGFTDNELEKVKHLNFERVIKRILG